MFKKKTKKDQGVLLAEEEHIPAMRVDSDLRLGSSRPTEQPENVNKDQSQQINKEPKNKKNENNCLEGDEKERRGQPQPENLKRAKNSQFSYQQDAHDHLENEPRRIERESFRPVKAKGGFNVSTLAKKEDTQRQVHDAFNDISHRAGTNLIKDMDLPQDELEEEVAKRRYMENVERTKLAKEGKLNGKIYRGMNAYTNHRLTSNDIKNAEESYKKVMGPSRINSTIKNSCRFDYVQNLCKDWHDSGYCPFGNSCLYLHDRSNVKTGWELEKDFEQQQRERWKRINNPELAKKEDREKLLKTIQKFRPPEECECCQTKFSKPVEVECGHIFCTPCAIKMLKCHTCNKKLSGIMNCATEKISKLSQHYEQLLAKLENEQEETLQKRRKFQNVNSLDVFAD